MGNFDFCNKGKLDIDRSRMVQISASQHVPVRSYECTKIKMPYYNYIVQVFRPENDFGKTAYHRKGYLQSSRIVRIATS